MARLVAIKGPAKGQEFSVGDACIVGRSFEADVRLNDVAVSRQHAKITKTAMGHVIVDLGSSNGTSVNGERVFTPRVLHEGDTIEIAENVFTFVGISAPLGGMKPEPDLVIFSDGGHEKDSTITGTMELTMPLATERLQADPAALYRASVRLKTILALTSTIQRELELGNVLEEIMSGIFRIFRQADRGFLMLRDATTGTLVPTIARTRGGQDPGKVTISRHIRDEALRKRVGVLVQDAMTDTRFAQAESIVQMRIRSVMCVPLVAENDLVGLLHIDSLDPNAVFSLDDLEMLTGIANQAAAAIASATLHKRLMEQQRLERDLQLAQQVQLSFLPEGTPNIEGMKFRVHYQMAMKVGGDFYDFVEQSGDRLAIVIGDVAGKGIPAALFMAKMTSDARFLAMSEREPKDILTSLNKRLARASSEGSFVTLLLACLDVNEGRLTIANAGHLPPVIRANRGDRIMRVEERIGFPLGVVPDTDYEQAEIVIKKGDSVSLFTDGVTEAMNAAHQCYGEERLLEVIARSSADPDEVRTRVLDDVRRHVGETPQSDDLTFLCFGRTL